MNIGGVSFSFVCDLIPDKEPDGVPTPLLPQARYVNSRDLLLNKHGEGPFCRFRIPNTYRCSGVYVMAVNGAAQYVGECVNLSSRYNVGYGNISPRNCFKGGQETNCRLNSLIYQEVLRGCHVSLWFFQTENHKPMERVLLAGAKFPWNAVHSHFQTPVFESQFASGVTPEKVWEMMKEI